MNAQVIIEILSRGGARVAGDINKILKDTERSAIQTDRAIAQSNKARLAEQSRNQKRAADDFLKELKRVESAEKQTSAAFSRLGGSISSAMSQVGAGISSVGKTLTVAITAPIVAIGSLGVKSALELDAVRTKITALVGDVTGANQKLAELTALALKSVGVLPSAAYDTFAQLKGIGGVVDETINKVIVSMGKLNAAFKIEDQPGFIRNLNQIFTQGFERADIKEAIGRVPFFEQLLEQAFGTKDQAKLKKLRESGKLTLDGFLGGLSEAINTDPRIANITENLNVKMAKAFERLNIALAPIGQIILDTVVPAFEFLVPYVEAAAKWFGSLSTPIKAVIVGIGAFVAAIGPALLILGGIVTAIGSVIGAVSTIAAALAGVPLTPVLLGIAAAAVVVVGAFTAVAAGAVALYEAWQANFGGIRDLTLSAWESIKSVISSAMDFIYGVVQEVGGAIVGWWKENYPLIRSTIETVSGQIIAHVQRFLARIKEFWDTYGAGIKQIVSDTWNQIKDFIGTAMSNIGDVIRLALQVLHGRWSDAWQSVLKITERSVAYITKTIANLGASVLDFFSWLLPKLIEWWVSLEKLSIEWAGKVVAGIVYVIATLPDRLAEIIPALVAVNVRIGEAIWRGIKQGLQGGTLEANIGLNVPGAKGEVVGATETISSVPTISSVSGGASGGSKKSKLDSDANDFKISKILADFNKALRNLDPKLKQQILDAAARYGIPAALALAQIFSESNFNPKAVSEQGATGLTQGMPGTTKQKRFGGFSSQEMKDPTNALTFWGKYMTFLFERYGSWELAVLAYHQGEGTVDKLVAALKTGKTGKGIIGKKGQAYRDKIDLLSGLSGDSLYKTTQESGEAKKLADDAQKLIDDRIARIQDGNERILQLDRSNAETQLAIQKQLLDTKQIGEVEYAENVGEIRLNSLKLALHLLSHELQEEQLSAEKRAELETDLQLLKDEIQRQEITNANERREATQKEQEEIEKLTTAYNKLAESKIGVRDVIHGDKPGAVIVGDDEGQEGTGGIFGALVGSMRELFNLGGQLPTLASVFTDFANIVSGAFQGIASAIGSVVQNFVLYGKTGPAVMRQILASALATIAAEAAVRAIYELAAGFAALFLNPAEAAAHFTAAAIFGSVAGVAAITGRAVAGNAFRREAATATGGTATQSGSRSEGSAYSSRENAVIDQSRNAPSGVGGTLVIRDKTGMFDQLFEAAWERNGGMRRRLTQEFGT